MAVSTKRSHQDGEITMDNRTVVSHERAQSKADTLKMNDWLLFHVECLFLGVRYDFVSLVSFVSDIYGDLH